MRFSEIFGVFSRRQKQPLFEPTNDIFSYNVPETLRTKILLYCRELFSNDSNQYRSGDCTSQFWAEIHRALQYRHGKFRLIENIHATLPSLEVAGFLMEKASDAEFLDFIEYIFHISCLHRVCQDENDVVVALNDLFRSENAGYELSKMIKEEVEELINDYRFGERVGKVIKTIAYPQIILKSDHYVHQEIVIPALTFLGAPAFRLPNAEFLEALEHFRQKEYEDCLTKCCSAFESVLKVICQQSGWAYSQNDTAHKLIQHVLNNSSLDGYFEQPLVVIATLRNRLSSSHGAGNQPRVVPEHIARYALNATASAIILLVEEANQP